ncbi:hypothetical protein [Streptomyces sp. NBC_01006]|uniref:hypothetical protein n=1 Tax=Streptomyces sp. NBC_01006 TaxID=2903716 RepID=UPI00386392D6|nr:hypothetical protein OG509_40350 [Streptomyces sp. NBC_01006]
MPTLTMPSVRFPEVLPDGFAATGTGETGEELDRFAHTSARLRLGTDGLTTPLLEAWVGSVVSVRRMSHRFVLASSSGVDLSRNVVVARPGLSAAAEQCLTDPSAPIGRMLQAAGTGRRRTIVEVGMHTWGGEPAAYETYPATLRAPLAPAGRS